MKCNVCGGESQYPDMCEKCHTARWIRQNNERERKTRDIIHRIALDVLEITRAQ